LVTAILSLVSIASIVTPFGLYDTIQPGKYQTKELFTYLRDDSAFGYGTPPRSNAPFTRTCGTDFGCPGQSFNQTEDTLLYDPRIPPSIMDLFGDGVTKIGSSVSSLFDIQWRTYSNESDGNSILGWFLQAGFRQLTEVILDGKVEAIEGLIVDMVGGGVGFRNHTAPFPPLLYGSTWTEDILFIEPETQCVNLNITIDFILPDGSTAIGGFTSLNITDRGGLSGLNRIRPSFDTSPNGQTDLNLEQRAYTAAWFNNFMTLVFYNATDPYSTNLTRLDVAEGAAFPIPLPTNMTDINVCNSSSLLYSPEYDAIMSSMYFGGYLNLFNSTNQPSTAANPYGVGDENLTSISKCPSGSLPSDLKAETDEF
jgi:hypothetical protein